MDGPKEAPMYSRVIVADDGFSPGSLGDSEDGGAGHGLRI